MAVIDDEFLAAAIRQAGDAFALPQTGADDILARARRAVDPPRDADSRQAAFDLGDAAGTAPGEPLDRAPHLRRVRSAVVTHRVLSAAAAVVVVAAVGGAALLFGRSSPVPTSGVTALAPSLPTTTLPVRSGLPGTPTKGAQNFAPSAGTGHAASGTAATPQLAAPATGGAGSTDSAGITPTTVPPAGNGTVGQPARIQQTGSLDLQVGNVQAAIAKLSFLAAEYNGFVANSQSEAGSGPGSATGSVTLQVPVGSFSAVLKNAQSFGKTLGVQTKATDVTAQYVDLQAQITALEASRAQYLTIMARATTIGDVLAVQSQLDNLQTQIQQLQGQLNVLASETTYSTLNVLVSESAVVHHRPPPQPESGLARAWHDSVHGFVAGIDGLVRVAGPALFALLLAGVVLVAGRLLWRRYQRHRL